MVYRVCRGVLRNGTDAEDAAQATFLVLVQKASRVRKLDSLPSWLHGVAFRTARKLRAALARRRARETRFPVAARTTVEDLTVGEAGEVLHEELEKLPARYKGPLVLCYLQGKTHDEAAAELGWTVTAFRGRLERARNRLRDRLGRRGLTPSAAPLAGILAEVRPALPATFAVTTARAAVSGPTAAVARGLISSTASYLAQEVLRSMSFIPLKFAGLLVLAVALPTCGWLAMYPASAAPPPVEPKAEAAPEPRADDSADEKDARKQLDRKASEQAAPFEYPGAKNVDHKVAGSVYQSLCITADDLSKVAGWYDKKLAGLTAGQPAAVERDGDGTRRGVLQDGGRPDLDAIAKRPVSTRSYLVRAKTYTVSVVLCRPPGEARTVILLTYTPE